MKRVTAEWPTTPRTKDSQHAAIAFAGILIVMALTQLFSFEKFIPLLEGFHLPGSAAAMMFAQSDLGANDMKVFFALLAKLDFENLLVVNQAEIARQIGMNRHHVNRSIKRLLELEVIFEGPRIGVSRSYRLNEQMGWKGSASNHRKALEKRIKQSGLKVIKGSK